MKPHKKLLYEIYGLVCSSAIDENTDHSNIFCLTTISVNLRKMQPQCGNLFLEAFFQFPSVSPRTSPEAWKYQWIILIFSKVTVEDFMVNSEAACKILIFILKM